MKYTPRQPKINNNVSPVSPLKELLLLTGGALAIVVGLYGLLGLALDLIVPRLSVDFENRLGGLLAHAVPASREGTSPQQRWVQDLTDRFQHRCVKLPYSFRIHISPQKEVNALALPGGRIVVFQGLLDQISSENELVFVLGHEMGHYAHRDHLRGLGRSLVFMSLAVFLFGPDNSAASFLAHTMGLVELSFSRQQEVAADEFGLAALNCLYGHVGGATDFFGKIHADRDPGAWGHYFTSHPANARRIAHLNALARQRGYSTGAVRGVPQF